MPDARDRRDRPARHRDRRDPDAAAAARHPRRGARARRHRSCRSLIDRRCRRGRCWSPLVGVLVLVPGPARAQRVHRVDVRRASSSRSAWSCVLAAVARSRARRDPARRSCSRALIDAPGERKVDAHPRARADRPRRAVAARVDARPGDRRREAVRVAADPVPGRSFTSSTLVARRHYRSTSRQGGAVRHGSSAWAARGVVYACSSATALATVFGKQLE